MSSIVNGSQTIQHDSLAIIPLGGQGELGQLLWVVSHSGVILLVDAGAAYPSRYLPGVDLLLPNTNFLEANQEKIAALLLTNGHEEHSGAVPYLLRHLDIPRILAPRFVSQLLTQSVVGTGDSEAVDLTACLDTIEFGNDYEIGPFNVEWLPVNNAIADASGLKIESPNGTIIYTSSFKLDQTPVDGHQLDIHRFARAGEKGVTLLISDSAGVEYEGYTASESSLERNLESPIANAPGRVFVVFPGTNTHRLQLFFDIASRTGRKVVLIGDSLLKTALSAVVTGNLKYDRDIETSLENIDSLKDEEVMIILSGIEDDPLNVLNDLAFSKREEVELKSGDSVVYSGPIMPGKLRFMAGILDQLLSKGVRISHGYKRGLHVSKHASREELKLMLSLTRPRYFLPAIGEGRHIMHHAALAIEWGMPSANVFPVNNGDILEINHGIARVTGSIEASAVLFNRLQGEKVTTFSVKERKSLSHEGVVTVSFMLGENRSMVGEPGITSGASGFLLSQEWADCRKEIEEAVKALVEHYRVEKREASLGEIKNAVREATVRIIRHNLQSKPTIHVVAYEVTTSRH